MESDGSVELLRITRGGITESIHRGHIAAVDGDGWLRHACGDPHAVTFLRSSAKLHQAIPLLASGAAYRFGFTDDEIAVACSSHDGQEKHLQRVRSMLEKIGLGPENLQCGAHLPSCAEVAARLICDGKKPEAIHNNCSGKHAGMLALALHLGAPVTDYWRLEHPVQQEILKIVALFSDLPQDEIILGIDGCSVPTFGMAVERFALMFARLISPPAEFEPMIKSACARVRKAVTGHPDLIASNGKADTELMKAGGGNLIAKIGAEAVLCLATSASEIWPSGLGIAIKIEDGTGVRARGPVAVEALRQLKVPLSAADLEGIAGREIRNHRGILTGEIESVFHLT